MPPRAPSAGLRHGLRRALARLSPPLDVIAEDVLTLQSRVDWLAVDPQQRLVAVLLGDDGDDERLLTRALSHRAWIAARVADWRKLAPELRVDPEAPVRAMLLCSDFAPETRAAAASLPDAWVELVRLVRGDDDGAEPRLERIRRDHGSAAPAPARPPRASVFRSGLTPEDFGLSDDETAELE